MKDFFTRYGDRISPNLGTGCWEWTGSTTSSLGYGHFNRDGRHQYAHRAAYECVHGEGSADGLVVRHGCDNPPCCNPGHLLGGTHADNSADMWSRGRGNPARGERVHTAKLTEADVRVMRQLAAAGTPIARIVEFFPVRHHTAMFAVTGRTWKHLPAPVTELAKASPPGSKPGQGAKLLNEERVREMKAQLRAGAQGRALAKAYGVSPVTVSAIKVGRIWAHVD